MIAGTNVQDPAQRDRKADGHDHAHHDHPPHSHHTHAQTTVRPAQRPGFSLLRLSVVERLGVALFFVALIWAGVFWAIR